MSAGITEVGARLSLLNSPAFIRNAAAAAAAVDKLTAAIDRSAAVARASAAANDTLAASSAKVAEATGLSSKAQTDAALTSDAAIIRSRKAVTDATVTAAEAQKTALNSIANNPIVKKGAMVLGVGLFAGVYEALKSANQVQAKLTLLSTAAGVATKDLPYFMKGALDISNQYGTSLGSVLDVMYRIKSASVGMNESNAQVLANSKAAVQLGILQGGTMTPAQLDNTARVYGAFENAQLRGATTPQQISATVNAAVGAGDVRMSDVIGMIGKGGLAAAQASHMSAADMLGWMDTMTHFGGNPQNAGTLVAHAINLLQSGSKQSQEATQMGGINPGQLAAEIADPKVGLIGAMTTLKNSFQKFNPTSSFPHTGNETPKQAAMKLLKSWGIMTDQEFQAYTTGGYLTPQQQQQIQNAMTAKAFGSARQMTPEQTLLMNMMKAQGIITQINQKATPQQYAKDLALAQDTPLNQLKIAANKWKNMLIEVGMALQGPAKVIAKGFSDFAGWLQENMVQVEVALGAVAALGAAFIGLRVANRIAEFSKNLSDLGGPLARLRTGFSSVINTLTGGRFGTAAATQVAPTTEFAGAVNEFSAAVARFGGETLLGGAGNRIPGVVPTGTTPSGSKTPNVFGLGPILAAITGYEVVQHFTGPNSPGAKGITNIDNNQLHPPKDPQQRAAAQPSNTGGNWLHWTGFINQFDNAHLARDYHAATHDIGRTAAAMWHGLFGGGNPTGPSAASTVNSATGQAASLMKLAAQDQRLANLDNASGNPAQAKVYQQAEAMLAAKASAILEKNNPQTIYTTIQLDGKTIAQAVQGVIKKQAARN